MFNAICRMTVKFGVIIFIRFKKSLHIPLVTIRHQECGLLELDVVVQIAR